MDNQNNNFNNMIQPSGVPEVKDNNTSSPVNMFSNVNQPNMVNTSGALGEQSNGVNVQDTTVLNFSMPSTGSGALNVVPPVIENNNEVRTDLIENTTTLNFEVPSVNSSSNVVQDNNSLNNSLNSMGSVNSLNIEQTPIQPVEDVVNNNVQSSGNVTDNIGASVNNEVSLPSEKTESVSEKKEDVATVKDYLIHMILCSIPVVGIIILIVRAVNNKNKSISNLARAQLILSAIAVILCVVMFVIFGSMIFSVLG